jgi:hypothetical protein
MVRRLVMPSGIVSAATRGLGIHVNIVAVVNQTLGWMRACVRVYACVSAGIQGREGEWRRVRCDDFEDVSISTISNVSREETIPRYSAAPRVFTMC